MNNNNGANKSFIDRLKEIAAGFGLARSIILIFLVFLVVLALFLKLPMDQILSSVLARFGMNGILVLAMIPTIQSGTGPNFGLP
ncbi:MAG: simple sugar transport system permease protein, partial [Thermovirga sp.]|nr:simple sugar transport system permease protein [Thermovirga sp.]